MKKLMIGTLATMGCLGAVALDEIEFPNLMGDGVLTSDASWGEGGVPTDKRPNITSAGDYSIGRDISFAGLRFANFEKTGTATVTATGRKVTFDASIDVRHEHSVRFVGGLYDFQGKYASSYGSWNNQDSQRWDVEVELDGCVFTNMASFCTGYYTSSGGNAWTLKNSAGMYVKSDFWLGNDDKGNNRMNVLSGSRLVLGDNAQFPRGGATSVGSVLQISGDGSYFKAGSNFNCGARDFKLIVEDGAQASIGGSFWYYLNKGNLIRVEDASSKLNLGPLHVREGSVSNRIEAADGATLTLSSVTLNSCVAFGLVVSNATASLGGNFAAASGQYPSNCYVRVEGEDAKFTSNVNRLSFSGFATDFLVADGASASLGNSGDSVTLGGTACAFRARGEGTVLGIAALGIQGISNRVEVAEGATLNLKDVWLEGCRGLDILVSNATATVNGNDMSINAQGNLPSSDTTIRITGEGARFTAGQGFRLGGVKTRMRIENGASASVGSGYCYLLGTSNSVSVAGTGSSASVSSSYPNGAGHFYEAADGGVLNVGRVFLGNVDGFGLVVSNGTMNINGLSAETAAQTATNLYVVIRGDHPVLKTGSNGINFDRGLELRYSLPLDSYADDAAPIQISTWCPGDGTAKIVIENIEEIQKHLQKQGIRKQTYRLIYAPNGLQGMTLARLNGLLPKGCLLTLKNGYYELTVKVDLGCLLIVR